MSDSITTHDVTEFSSQIHDKRWRLRHLYQIKDAATGKLIPFRPRPEQEKIFDDLQSGHTRLIILKARRLGMSTAIDLWFADEAFFNQGYQCTIIDKNQDAAASKLRNIISIAHASLPAGIRSQLRTIRHNNNILELSIRHGDTISAIHGGKNTRGGTNQGLHISEWGVIQADDPRRSEEILTGAIPSAEHGVIVIETTWKGGRGGHLWQLVRESLELDPATRTRQDWKLHFFPWHKDPTCAADPIPVPPELQTYFHELEKTENISLSENQKSWYARRRKTLGLFICREYPSTIDECFRAPIEGAIYAGLIDRLRAEGSITPFNLDTSALVHTFWDIGSPINTVVWYAQFVGQEIRIIDCDTDLDLTPTRRVAHILGKGYPLGCHFLPHDAAATQKSGRAFQNDLHDAGLPNTRIVPQTHDLWIGINHLRQLLPRMRFRLPATEHGLHALSNYHTRRETSTGLAIDEPVHDWTSHAADALRILAEAHTANLIPGRHASNSPRPTRAIMNIGSSLLPRAKRPSFLAQALE